VLDKETQEIGTKVMLRMKVKSWKTSKPEEEVRVRVSRAGGRGKSEEGKTEKLEGIRGS
jgi:hypothetical protein